MESPPPPPPPPPSWVYWVHLVQFNVIALWLRFWVVAVYHKTTLLLQPRMRPYLWKGHWNIVLSSILYMMIYDYLCSCFVDWKSKDNQTILNLVVVLVAGNGTTLANITKLWIELTVHLRMEYLKIVLSSISIYNDIWLIAFVIPWMQFQAYSINCYT